MFMFAGQKIRTEELGYFAEFCPICRSIQAHFAIKRSTVPHLYFVPVGRKTTLDFIGTCLCCSVERGINPLSYKQTVKSYSGDLPLLINETYPTIYESYENRLNLEDLIKKDPSELDDNERLTLIREPFEVLQNFIERECGEDTKFDRKSGIGCFSTILLFVLIIVLAFTFEDNNSVDAMIRLFLIPLFLLGTLGTFILLALTPQRFIKNKVFPQLIKALMPLQPKKHELETVLNQFKSLGLSISRHIKLKPLLKAIMKERAS